MVLEQVLAERPAAQPAARADGPAPGRAESGPGPREPARDRYLFHPVVDFLCLGGGSLFVLALLPLFLSTASARPAVTAFVIMLAHVLNDPHFAHSYQIFYRNFRAKAFGPDYPTRLRLRYILAGLAVPAALFGFFATCVAMGDARLLAVGGNVMGFFVGWHYVKQGYGMLIVDSVLKRQFFADGEKKLLLVNAYACWALSWLLVNLVYAEREVQGFSSIMLRPPMALVFAAITVAAVTTVLVLYMLVRRRLAGSGKLPVNGAVAYFASLYVWLCPLVNPLFLLLVPALHSLQYLTVVWRYQWNAASDRAGGAGASAGRRFAGFVAAGLLLGYLGFWGMPQVLDALVPYDHRAFNGTMFMFMFWIFINLHHYFLDNVMWRRENPDTRKYLFPHG